MQILRLVLLALTAFVVISLAVTYLRAARPRHEEPTPVTAAPVPEAPKVSPEAIAAARRGIEEKLAGVRDYAQFFERLRTQFPADYETFVDRLAQRAAANGENLGEDQLLFEAARSLRLSHGILAAAAGVPALDLVFELQRTMLQALAVADPHLCVDFLYGGAEEGFFRFSAENRPLVARFALAGMDAIRDGQEKRIDRDAPTPEDLRILENGLRDKDLAQEEIEALLDGKTFDPPIEDTRLCRAGLIYLDVLAGLPEAARMRLYALAVKLMARS